MNCKQCHNDLIFYIDGHLSEERRQAVEAHLQLCGDCASFMDYLNSTLNVIDAEKKLKPSPFIFTRIKTRLEPEDRKNTAGLWQKIWQPAIFSLLLLLGVYSGIRLGQEFSEGVTQDFMTGEIAPLMNEMTAEPMELFLMN